jgi:hypothetical protein
MMEIFDFRLQCVNCKTFTLRFLPREVSYFYEGEGLKAVRLKDRMVVVDVINSLPKLGSLGKKVGIWSTQMNHAQMVERHASLKSKDRE